LYICIIDMFAANETLENTEGAFKKGQSNKLATQGTQDEEKPTKT